MIFSSLMFIFQFLPIVLGIYAISPKKYKNFVLFVSSLFFYSWGEPVYVLIMLFSTLVDYINGMKIEKYKEQGNNKKAKIFLIASIVINLSLLMFFKYTNFFITNVNILSGLSIKQLKLVLPIGISFYTFQTMSYSIDIYRGDAKAQKNLIDFGTYVVMFPQLIAGPIVKYKDISEQLSNRKCNIDSFTEGTKRFIIGLGKKVLLANNIGMLWEEILNSNIENLGVFNAWLGVFAFSMQIYFDFSGYSDMAIGLGKMFGFNIPENFNLPYVSKSITEFWRRWHISLSTWFKEYVYIPLGGNRVTIKRNILNLLIVWLLTGFWHGASWNFILWGLYYGIILIVEKFILSKWLEKTPGIIRHIYTIFLIGIGWIIFACEDITQLTQYIKQIFNFNISISNSFMYNVTSNIAIIIICIIASTNMWKYIVHGINKLIMWITTNKFVEEKVIKEKSIEKKDCRLSSCILVNAYYMLIFIEVIAFLVNSSYNPFLYFRF